MQNRLRRRSTLLAVGISFCLTPWLGPATLAHAQLEDECADAPAPWIFCDDFESGIALSSGYDDYDGNPSPTTVVMQDAGAFDRRENHVVRLRVAEGRGAADLVKILPSQHDRLYARWYVQWEPGYVFGTPAHNGGLHAGDRNLLGRSNFRPDGDDWFSAWIEPAADASYLNAYVYSAGMYMNCADPAGSCWGDTFPCTADEGAVFCEEPQHRETVQPPDLETGRWYCIEVMMDGGTPSPDGRVRDGVLNWWIDGLEIGPWDDLWLRTTDQLKLSILWINLFHHGDHPDEGILVDNVVVSTERIGCELGGRSVENGARSIGSLKAQFR